MKACYAGFIGRHIFMGVFNGRIRDIILLIKCKSMCSNAQIISTFVNVKLGFHYPS